MVWVWCGGSLLISLWGWGGVCWQTLVCKLTWSVWRCLTLWQRTAAPVKQGRVLKGQLSCWRLSEWRPNDWRLELSILVTLTIWLDIRVNYQNSYENQNYEKIPIPGASLQDNVDNFDNLQDNIDDFDNFDNLKIIPGASLQGSNPPQDNKAWSTKFQIGMHDYFLQKILRMVGWACLIFKKRFDQKNVLKYF